MEFKSPKELVSNITGKAKEGTKSAFSMKSKSTINGAFYGGAFGFLYGMHKSKKIYVTAVVGALIGGFVSNILTVKNE